MGRVFATRSEELANATNTIDVDHTFKVRTLGRFRKPVLRSATITLNASQGPCLAGMFLFKEPGLLNGIALGKREWIRSPSLGSQTGDIYQWTGEAAFSDQAEIRVYVRNDSGATVRWNAFWVTDG